MRCSARVLALSTIALVAIGTGSAGAVSVGVSPGAVVVVDLASPIDPPVQSGVVNGMTSTGPDPMLVAQLEPGWLRGWPSRARADRAESAGAAFQAVVSDKWGYPRTAWVGGGGVPPEQDLGAWSSFVTARARELGPGVEYDIWNEPDHKAFFSGTWDEFLAVFSAGEAAIRAEFGAAARVAGPSIHRFDPVLLTSILDHCLAVGCRIDTLTWHELLPGGADIDSVTEHVRWARELVAQPRYLPVGVRQVIINEFVGPVDQYRPAENLAYMLALEQGGAAGAMRACWQDALGSQCPVPTLGGLLTRDGEPRPVYWLMSEYSQLTDRRQLQVQGPAVAAAGVEGDTVTVLVGNPREGAQAQVLQQPAIELVGVGAGDYRVAVSIMHDTDEAAAPSPVDVGVLSTTTESLRIDLPDLARHSALLVEVTELTAGVDVPQTSPAPALVLGALLVAGGALALRRRTPVTAP